MQRIVDLAAHCFVYFSCFQSYHKETKVVLISTILPDKKMSQVLFVMEVMMKKAMDRIVPKSKNFRSKSESGIRLPTVVFIILEVCLK